MKTTRTMKQMMLAASLVLGLAACKKANQPTPPPVEVKSITFTELKALSTGTSVKVPDAKKISGVVISDVSGKNIDGKTVVLQEATDKPGIIIQFDAAQTFAVGDQLEVTISNQFLIQANGEVILDKVPLANAKKIGTGTVTARLTTADEVIKNTALWNGTLVTIGKGTFSGQGKYNGILEYTDATGKVKSNIASGAAFANAVYPFSIKSLTGIVRVVGTEVRIDLRNATDVGNNIAYTYTEDFQKAVVGEVLWTGFNNVFNLVTGDWTNKMNDYAFLKGGDKEADKDFLTAGKIYFYPVYSGTIGEFNTNFEDTKLKGVKYVTVTFAGSYLNKNMGNMTATDVLDVFDPAKHSYTFEVRPVIEKTEFASFGMEIGLTAEFKDQGKFHTVTFAVPSKEELVAKGATAEQADFFINNPDFNFLLTSSKRGSYSFQSIGTPVIIEKIEFGFDSKPTWAP
ncbi:DUF5689 domain-containing protein [Sphingobacterium sp. ML3W]|uniref:DUF5689 domain-containing protein n=1 Tax=Sphingobacterium sp. ML3W TaxID=1538644 RepID=UPI001186F40B|nr:DUF5689 domain-containing protein [Sphingobacterium sp. ML3W]